MSLRWTAMLPLSPQSGLKQHKLAMFPLKRHISWRKSAAKILCVNIKQQSCKTFTGLSIIYKWLVGDVPFYLKFSTNWPTPFKNGDIHRTIWLWGGQPMYALFTISTQRPYATCVSAIRISWWLHLILAKNYFIHFPYTVYHRCVYKHLAAAYNETGTMGTNQSAVRFTDRYT